MRTRLRKYRLCVNVLVAPVTVCAGHDGGVGEHSLVDSLDGVLGDLRRFGNLGGGGNVHNVSWGAGGGRSRRFGGGRLLDNGSLGRLGLLCDGSLGRLGLARSNGLTVRRMSAADVKVQVGVLVAALGLPVIWQDICALVARVHVMCLADGAVLVVLSRRVFSILVSGLEIVSVLPAGALPGSAVDERNVEEVDVGLVVVLQLRDLALLADLLFGHLDGDRADSGWPEVLRVGLSGGEDDGLVEPAVVRVIGINGPDVDIVRATVDDASLWLAVVAGRVVFERDVDLRGDSCSQGRDGGEGEELHFG